MIEKRVVIDWNTLSPPFKFFLFVESHDVLHRGRFTGLALTREKEKNRSRPWEHGRLVPIIARSTPVLDRKLQDCFLGKKRKACILIVYRGLKESKKNRMYFDFFVQGISDSAAERILGEDVNYASAYGRRN